jgi:hypothetical protein
MESVTGSRLLVIEGNFLHTITGGKSSVVRPTQERLFAGPRGIRKGIPQGLKPTSVVGSIAKAKALAYLEAKTKAVQV